LLSVIVALSALQARGRSAWDDPKLQARLQRNRQWLALLVQQRDQEVAGAERDGLA
jgi:hypothetical protein